MNIYIKKRISSTFCTLLLASLLLFASSISFALTLPINPGSDVVGQMSTLKARSAETLTDIGERTGTGYNEIVAANPNLHPKQSLSAGTKVVIPSQYVLPDAPREGIVINLPEFRLYYYPPGQNVVITEAVGIGKEGEGGWSTPIGITSIASKQKDPPWRPTENVRAEAARQGTPIPAYFAPYKDNPDNPLGKYAMRLGWSTYLIHSTNRPEFVGTRATAGCIRMFPKSIDRLFPQVAVGTKVTVVDQPFKSGWLNGKLYFEAHNPLAEDRDTYVADMADVVNIVHKEVQNQDTFVQWSVVQRSAKALSGIPAVIGHR